MSLGKPLQEEVQGSSSDEDDFGFGIYDIRECAGWEASMILHNIKNYSWTNLKASWARMLTKKLSLGQTPLLRVLLRTKAALVMNKSLDLLPMTTFDNTLRGNLAQGCTNKYRGPT